MLRATSGIARLTLLSGRGGLWFTYKKEHQPVREDALGPGRFV